MKFRLWLAAAIFLCASTQAPGAINAWTPIGPSGGTVNKIVFNKSTPTIVYAIAAGGFYRSQDGGVSWQLISSDFLNAPQDLAIDPADPNRVYVVAPNYPCLYMSTDGGATLSALTTVPTAVTSAWQVAVSQSGTILYLTSARRIFYSADRGVTWTERTAVGSYSDGRVLKLLIDPTDANSLYASATTSATDAGIFASHDGAVTWHLLTSGPESASLPTDLAINAANSSQIWSTRYDGIWFSSDKGVTWNNTFPGGAFEAIVIDPSNPAILYAGLPGGQIVKTINAGANWTDVTGNNTSGQITTLVVDPSQSMHVLVGGMGGISGTSTAGAQWSTQKTGLISTSIVGLSADASADRVYIDVSSGGIYYSAGGAATTVAVNNSASDGLGQFAPLSTFYAPAILAQPGRLSVSLSNGLARSADGGSTWSLVPVTPSGSNQVFSFASSAMNPQTILGATISSMYRTTDGGDLWTQAATGLPANAIVGKLAASASDPTIFYASVYSMPAGGGPNTYFGVYKSTDAGLSWAPANAGIASSAIGWLTVDPTNANIVYAAANSAMKKSVDGGATWTTLTFDFPPPYDIPYRLAIDPKHHNILIGSGVIRISRSVDGGVTWQALRASEALPAWAATDVIVDPNRTENILAATSGSGVQQFTVAPDLSLSVAAPGSPVAVGVAASYTYTLSNLGPFDATGVQVRVQLPATAQSITATASGGTCSVAAGVATCIFDIARVGISNTITLNATAPEVGSFQLAAEVSADQPDAVSSNNTLTTTESVANVADLSVTASGNATAKVGEAVSYTVVVKNTGPNVATAAQLKVQLAAGLTLGSATGTGASCTSGTTGLVTCALGDLAATQSVTVTINTTAATAGAQAATATVSTTVTDSVTTNNSATSTTTVVAAPPPAASKGGGGSLSVNDLLLLALLSIMQWRAQRAINRR